MPGFQVGPKGQRWHTAEGFLVPPNKIPGCYATEIPSDLYATANWSEQDSTTEKGHKAVVTVRNLLLCGLLPLPLTAGIKAKSVEITERDIDINGTDIDIFAKVRMQIKCDYRGGPKELGGTGNLFLQVAESNPFARH